MASPNPIAYPNSAAQFPSTLWSIVRSAQHGQGEAAALEKLCQAYWNPLYSYVRRLGYSPEDAQDLTQEFLSRLLNDQSLASVHESKGRFRSFLLAAFKHLLANEWKRTTRQKRGGGQAHFSLDEESAAMGPDDGLLDQFTPEKAYERRWAETLLQRVLDRLRSEWETAGRTHYFDELKVFLVERKGAVPFGEAAERLAVSEASLKWAVHKLRQRYRELVREEIAQTVSCEAEIDEEIRHLFSVLTE